ncbi:MAG: hypothetical protein QM532_03515 [Cyanobium sp. MAG06]|nr:hypothetical protein [Cyanobium sp. MAG06]
MINQDIIEYKNIVVLYHGDCMDGFASSYVAWREFADNAEYIACKDRINLPDYIINHNDKNNTEIYLLDFSFPIDKLLYMQNNFKKLTMIDHHISAEQNIKSLREYVFALNKSGAVLS